mgnify:CR=1 FL=1|jgi:hypothetical protein
MIPTAAQSAARHNRVSRRRRFSSRSFAEGADQSLRLNAVEKLLMLWTARPALARPFRLVKRTDRGGPVS